jgi:curved DNA-binding protein CbpA
MARTPDPYLVLGVPLRASTSEIRRAFRAKVREAHPDHHPADPAAVARFAEILHAYQTLSDPAARSDYNQSRDAYMRSPHTVGDEARPWGADRHRAARLDSTVMIIDPGESFSIHIRAGSSPPLWVGPVRYQPLD